MQLPKNIKKINQYKLLTYTCGLLLSFSNHSFAADWASIKKTKDYELLVDMDSYNETNQLPYITAKTVYKYPKDGLLNSKKIIYLEEHSTTQFNCKLQLYKTLETRYFNNKLLATNKPFSSFQPLKRGSDHAATASLVCQVHKMLGGS
jgi:hypothetical protein